MFNGIWSLPYDFQLSGLYFYGSGMRVATSDGADFRDSGAYSTACARTARSCRPTIWSAIRSTGVDLRVMKRLRLGARRSIEGSLEMFNLFNHKNYGSYVTAESNTLFGQPQQNANVAYQPLMLQLGFRVAF